MEYFDGILSIAALSIVAILCGIGVFHPMYDDTLGQRLGMSLIGVWCILRIQVKLTEFDTEPVHMVLHIGLAIYAVSTALKLRRTHRAQSHEALLQKLDEWTAR